MYFPPKSVALPSTHPEEATEALFSVSLTDQPAKPTEEATEALFSEPATHQALPGLHSKR